MIQQGNIRPDLRGSLPCVDPYGYPITFTILWCCGRLDYCYWFLFLALNGVLKATQFLFSKLDSYSLVAWKFTIWCLWKIICAFPMKAIPIDVSSYYFLNSINSSKVNLNQFSRIDWQKSLNLTNITLTWHVPFWHW